MDNFLRSIDTTETHQTHQFALVADARIFALAGNAIFTLESLKSGAHFTFRVRQANDKATGEPVSDLHFVSLLNGSNNESDYMYIGIVSRGVFRLTRNSKAGETASSVMAFKYFWNLRGDTFPDQLVVRHCNKCGRCGRALTVPSSIDSGLGPDCRELMGLDL